jgi:hypothetical protein
VEGWFKVGTTSNVSEAEETHAFTPHIFDSDFDCRHRRSGSRDVLAVRNAQNDNHVSFSQTRGHGTSNSSNARRTLSQCT